MISVSIKQLVSAIVEADVYKLPYMNDGTEYLYNNLYRQLSSDKDVTLSELDFDAFGLEDIDSLNDLHENVFERNSYVADGIISTLQKTTPVCRSVCYV